MLKKDILHRCGYDFRHVVESCTSSCMRCHKVFSSLGQVLARSALQLPLSFKSICADSYSCCLHAEWSIPAKMFRPLLDALRSDLPYLYYEIHHQVPQEMAEVMMIFIIQVD